MTNIEVQARERFGIEGLGETYRQRVTKLGEKMNLNWGKVRKGLGDHESLGSWLGLVTYEDGREGQELTEKMAGLAGKIEKGENLKASELLEMMAFSEAKLRKLETMGSGEISGVSVSAFEVYPALADEAREMLRELREEKEKVMSRQGSLPGGGWKYRLGAGMAVGGVLLAACTGAAGGGVTPSPVEGGGGSSKPVVGEVTETLVTPTETMEPTVEATEVVKDGEVVVLMEDRVEYGGRSIGFEITYIDKYQVIKKTLDKYSIEAFSFNENNPEARKRVAEALNVVFLKTYNYQNKTSVSMGEFVKEPEKYPAKIVIRNNEGKLETQTISLDMVKEFEMRFVAGLDGELYMKGPRPDNFGFGFEDGKFTLFSAKPKFWSFDEGKDFGDYNPFFFGFEGPQLQFYAIANLPYSVAIIEDHKTVEDIAIKFGNYGYNYESYLISVLYPKGFSGGYSDYEKAKQNGVFVAELR